MVRKWACRRCAGKDADCVWCEGSGEVDLHTAAYQEKNTYMRNVIPGDEATKAYNTVQHVGLLLATLPCTMALVWLIYLLVRCGSE